MSNRTMKRFLDFLTDMAKKEPNQKIPKECPLIKTCNQGMLESEYVTICCSESWVFCRYAIKRSKKYRKPPYFWKFAQKIQGEIILNDY